MRGLWTRAEWSHAGGSASLRWALDRTNANCGGANETSIRVGSLAGKRPCLFASLDRFCCRGLVCGRRQPRLRGRTVVPIFWKRQLWALSGYFEYDTSHVQSSGGVTYLDTTYVTQAAFVFAVPSPATSLSGSAIGAAHQVSINAVTSAFAVVRQVTLEQSTRIWAASSTASPPRQIPANRTWSTIFRRAVFRVAAAIGPSRATRMEAIKPIRFCRERSREGSSVSPADSPGAGTIHPPPMAMTTISFPGALFTKVTLPTGLGGPFTIKDGATTLGSVPAGGTLTFAGSGVSHFQIIGISPLVDPEDSARFPCS